MQQGLGVQRLVELDLAPLLEVLAAKLPPPAAMPEALVTRTIGEGLAYLTYERVRDA
jgi:hypothetical protein